MADTKMRLVDWLDDLCVRFIINLPQEELESVERICFQVEEAQWFYEDFIRPLDPALPSMNLKKFCLLIFQHCPLLSAFSEYHHTQAYSEFLAYKTRVPVRGAIMLNDTMDHAVLVKGWKKGAKWSFPRGKINKEEKDLDCAIREVYEETGYDINEAGLVKEEEDMKYIEVSMREQHMRLYVFRGVPMDTSFAPRTRKEISKISWYRLSDLPTLKRKNQHTQQVQYQGTREDVYKDNMFYMVAPFLGPLRAWINKQRKQDKLNIGKSVNHAPLVTAETELETEAEESAARLGNLTANEGPNGEPADGDFNQLLANLGRGHRASDNLPEVSATLQAVDDPAEDLKRLLRVGLASSQEPLVSPPEETQTNPLLASLRNNGPPFGPPPPQTPFEQIIVQPNQPRSPYHQHPRPPHFSQMQPPPSFPLSPPHVQASRPQSGEFPPNGQRNSFGQQGHFSPKYRPPPNAPNVAHPIFNSHGPNIQPFFVQDGPRPYQRTGDPQFAQPPQFPGLHGPAIPPASKLPPPKLTAHSLSLLNAFKSPAVSKTTPQMQQPSEVHGNTSTKQPRIPPIVPEAAPIRHIVDSPILQSPRNVFGGERPAPPPVAPKPRNSHQDSLLNLLRSPSISDAPLPPATLINLVPEPIELAAHPTPGHPKHLGTGRHMSKPGMIPSSLPHLNILPNDTQKPSLTSATVSGPLNAPDFDTLKHTRPANGLHSGHASASASPQPPTQPEMKATGPLVSILTRPAISATASPSPRSAVPISPKTNIIAPKPAGFHPKILRRPQPTPSPIANAPPPPPAFVKPTAPTLNPPSKSHTTIPSTAPTVDRRKSIPHDQKSALLSLFTKPTSTIATGNGRPTTPHAPHVLGNTNLSGIISPVSPASALQGSPAGRSRISSIGEQVASSNPNGVLENVFGKSSADSPGLRGAGRGAGIGSSIPPPQKKTSSDNKAFLLGFLEDVTRGKR